VTYVPILLGGLMKMCDNRAPIEIRNKGKWIDVERLRWARQFDIPMSKQFPKGFPKPTLHLQRFLAALELTTETEAKPTDQKQRPETLIKALDTLYAALWTEPNEADLPDPKVFGPILEKALGPDLVSECMTKMSTPAVKKHLSTNTDRALDEGAFGLPWFQCTNTSDAVEGFWGFDHLGQVVRFLGLEQPATTTGTGAGEVRALL